MTLNLAQNDRAATRRARSQPAETGTTFAVVDDHPLMRLGVIEALSAVPGLALVAEGSTSSAAVRIALELAPDLMLLDLNMPGHGLEALRQIRQRAPGVRCMMLTVEDTPERALECLEEGALGYVLKGVGGDDLLSAARSVLRGETFVSPQFATRMVSAALTRGAGTPAEKGLSLREEQVLAALERGMTNKQIAASLNLSERTVKHYMTSVMQRFGVSNRVAAVVEYRKSRARDQAAD